ncbi:unnamed protein product [Mucor circinelloides]
MKLLSSVFTATLAAVSTALPTAGRTSLNTINGDSGDASTTPFYVTAPLENTTYIASSTMTTTWLNGVNEQFTIVVLQGDDPASMKPIGLNLTANGKTGTYAWIVPTDLVGGTYAFQYIFNLSGIPSTTYSNQFKVIGNGSANSTTTPTAEVSSSTI